MNECSFSEKYKEMSIFNHKFCRKFISLRVLHICTSSADWTKNKLWADMSSERFLLLNRIFKNMIFISSKYICLIWNYVIYPFVTKLYRLQVNYCFIYAKPSFIWLNKDYSQSHEMDGFFVANDSLLIYINMRYYIRYKIKVVSWLF